MLNKENLLRSIRLEAIAIRLEAIASRLEAIASRLEAFAVRMQENVQKKETLSITPTASAICYLTPYVISTTIFHNNLSAFP